MVNWREKTLPTFIKRMDEATTRNFSVFILVVAPLQLLRLVYIMPGGESRIVGILPDDAFYYFQLAKNFAALGHWTFDGTAPTTGFHLLWAYFLSFVFMIAPDVTTTSLFLITFVIGLACYLAAAAALSILVVECYGRDAILSVFAILCGTVIFLIPSMGMEAAPTMMMASFAALLLLRPSQSSPFSQNMPILFGVGLTGMLCRSDFGVLPFGIFAAKIICDFLEGHLSLRRLKPSLVLFAGSIVGLLVVFGHSYLVSGHILQSSAEIKSYWSSLSGHPLGAPIKFVARIFAFNLYIFRFLEYPILISLLGGLTFSATVIKKRKLPLAPFIAAILIGIGYIILYSHNSRALLPWYAQAFAVPLVVGLAPAAAACAAYIRLPMLAATCLIVLGGFTLSLRQIAPYQFAMRDGGKFLAQHTEIAPVGAWNAGLIGFFAKRPVTNLDGLVNDNILPYVISGTLAQYVLDQHLNYIIDYQAMFVPGTAARGGYKDGVLLSCLTPVKEFDSHTPKSMWAESFLTLYKVDRHCLTERLARP